MFKRKSNVFNQNKLNKALMEADKQLALCSTEQAVDKFICYELWRAATPGLTRTSMLMINPVDIEERLAKEVIEGKWSNGTERVKLLREAGYDYDAIQNKVNNMINEGYVIDIKERLDYSEEHKPGEKWNSNTIVCMIKTYMKCRDEKTGKYDPKIKHKIDFKYGVRESAISNTVNRFLNSIDKGDPYKIKDYFTKEELVLWKYRDKQVRKNRLKHEAIPEDELEILRRNYKDVLYW